MVKKYLYAKVKLHVDIAMLVAITVLSIVSLLFRASDFEETTGSQNLEAQYHALLTIHALQENSIENHWLLPTVSLGRACDKHIPWGATVSTKTGDYVYTSFAPPGFVAPYVIFSLFDIEVNSRNLSILNAVIGAVVSLLLYFLLKKILIFSGYNNHIAVTGALVGSLISIFSREVLQSHGLVYWPHSLNQIFLVLALYFLLSYMVSDDCSNKNKWSFALVVTVFFCAWTEWSGYVFGIGLGLMMWFGVLLEKPRKRLAVALCGAVAAAGLLTFLHYGLAVGFRPATHAFLARFLARNTAAGSWISLLNGYFLSGGLFLLVALLAVCIPFVADTHERNSNYQNSRIPFLIVVSIIPVVENLIMLQHASQFSFDRLKIIFPLAILISIGFCRLNFVSKIFITVIATVACFQGLSSYKADLRRYQAWKLMDQQNKVIAKAVKSRVDLNCSVLLANKSVRGYANLLFGRGIYEFKNFAQLSKFMNNSKACYGISLEEEFRFPDLPYYKKAIILEVGGDTTELQTFDLRAVKPKFFISDSNWERGVARRWAGFFIPTKIMSLSGLTSGTEIMLANGEIREVERVERQEGGYTHIHLTGTTLDPAVHGNPYDYVLIQGNRSKKGLK